MKSIFFKILTLIAIASVLAIGVNGVRLLKNDGIAWTKDWSSSMEVRAEELGLKILTLEEAQNALMQGLVLILDARPEEEYFQGRIPGAMNLPAHMMDAYLPDIMMMVFPDQPVIVYCGGADCEDSLIVAQAIQELGVLDVSIYKGGIQEWRAAGLQEEGL